MRYAEWSKGQADDKPPMSAPDDLWELTLAEASDLIKARLIKSEVLVESCLSRIAGSQELNAFISIDPTGALKQAKAYDQYLEGGGVHLPLGGVPIAIKDNIQVVGFSNTAGTPALSGFFPKRNAPVVELLIQSGAIVLGKTNMHELAFGTSGYNTAFHMPGVVGVRNAFDRLCIAGGSSSGSGSAVGARLVPAALGTDTGGSVRQPAALNGCVGFRPTVGRYSTEGVVPISHTRDTPGPITRSVQDTILLDSLITGAKKVVAPAAPSIRLGVVKEFWDGLSDPVGQVAESALEALRENGVELISLSLPAVFDMNGAISMPIALHECRVALTEYLALNDTGVTFNQVVDHINSPDVKKIFEHFIISGRLGELDGKPILLEQAYEVAMTQGRPQLIELFHSLFKEHGLHGVVHPTTPDLAIVSGPDATTFEAFARMIRNADPASNAGMPGISLPAGLAENTGLPVGIEIDGLPGSDEHLLAVASVIERILGRGTSPAA